MISKFREKVLFSDSRRTLFSNFSALFILKISNSLLPLLTFPYLVRVLGVEKFGLLGFVAATIGYFTILVNFGFQLSATRQISIVKNDKVKVMEIFSTVMSVKIILILLSLLLLTLMVFSFDIFRTYWFLYYFAFLSIIGTTMFPLWFFQGMEKMKYITYIDIVSKLFYTVSIFLFVHQADDYYLVPLLQSTFIVISGVIALYLIYTKFGIRNHLNILNFQKKVRVR
jgi:PST family polysaccharide transporter